MNIAGMLGATATSSGIMVENRGKESQ